MTAVETLRRGLAAAALACSLLGGSTARAVDPPHLADCRTCHVPHSGVLVDPGERLCRSCHYAAGPAREVANHDCTAGQDGCRFTFGEGKASPVTCTSCHDPHAQWQARLHGSTLGGYVRQAVRTPGGALREVVYTSVTGTGSLADGDAAFAGVCEVCHTLTAYHRGDPGGDHAHFVADACRVCHSHENHFRPRGCAQCHGAQQGSRRVVAPGGGPDSADFARASHHVTTGVRNEDCTTCHYYAEHRSGTVRVRDPDGAAVIAYAGDASLAPVCAGCHDGDGASARGGTTPFTSGAVAPDVAGAGWAASAHATGGGSGAGLSCFGSGTGGCHGNAHGSSLPRLGAPFDADPASNPAAGEEGLCYRCHSAGAVVNEPLSNGWIGGSYVSFGADVESAFAAPSSHPVRDSDPRHVFTVGGVARELECTSCHGVHQDTGRYRGAPAGVTPVVDPWTRLPWGDDPGEKIGAWDPLGVYQAPSMGAPGLDLAGAPLPIDASGASLLTAAVRPDYVTFCLSCHAQALGTTRGIDWRGSKHGSAAAEPVGTLGFPMVAPYADATRGAYVLDCLDCHEAHGSPLGSLARQSLNGAVVTVGPDAATTLRSLCNTCHAAASRHHNADVQAKAGVTGCAGCHPSHSGTGSMYYSCLKSGCHNHGEFF